MKKTFLCGLIALFTGSLAFGQTPSPSQAEVQKEIAVAREVISRYVTTRQQIARLRNEWNSYQEITDRRIRLYEQEIARLSETIRAAQEDTTQAERVIAGIRDEIAEMRRANDIIRQAVPELEGKLLELAQFFPDPLRNRINPLLQRIGKSRSASDSMAVIIGIMNEVDRFNADFNQDSMQKRLPSGEVRLVDVIYVGLALAYYADAEGTVGGVGFPAEGGWQWTERNDLASNIRRSIQFYQGQIKPAMMVDLPVEVKNIRISN